MEMEAEAQSSSSSVIILHNATIVTMDWKRRVYPNGGMAIEHDRIIDIDHSEIILEEYSGQAREIVDLHGQIVLPGFINTHVHTSQQLARGLAGDEGLMTLGHSLMWRFEANMTEEDSYISALLCGIELIHSGVTCFAEAGGQHVSSIARAVELLGLRACLAESIMDSGDDLPEQWANRTAKDCIQSQKELYRKHHNTADGRIRVWLGIKQITNATDDLLLKTKEAAKELGTGIHMNVAEIPYKNRRIAYAQNVNHGAIKHLKKLDFLQKNLLAANAVWLDDDERGFLSLAGVKVSHCPAVAMRLRGTVPTFLMLESNICMSLGTDGAPSNSRMSIIDEMYLASLRNEGRTIFDCVDDEDETIDLTLDPETVLSMATIDGAKSVLWDDEIGQFEEEKKADLVVINPNTWSMVPVLDSISSLVYSMRTENIASVMCNGRWIMKDKKILTVNEEEVLSLAKEASGRVMRRAGIEASN